MNPSKDFQQDYLNLRDSVSSAQIAKDEHIPAAYLEQILFILKKKSWVRSLRGPSGGYILAKKPSDIRIRRILKDLEPSKLKAGDTHMTHGSKSPRLSSRAAHLFWLNLSKTLESFLDSWTLQGLLDEARAKNPKPGRSQRLDFTI